MSIQQNVYLGPYAELKCPLDPELVERFESRFRSNRGVSEPVRCYCLMPVADRIGSPPRACHLWQVAVIEQDVEGIDRAAESRWFATEYEAELAELAAHTGEQPSIRWGLIAWLS